MDKGILFVDDEKQILSALNRVFIGQEYNVFTAESGEKALEILRGENIHLLITDIRMPKMDGYQLLKSVKSEFPSTIRLVLSGHMDEGLLLRIKKDSLAKLYIFKPWQNQELIDTVKRILKVEDLLKSKNLLELINKIDFLPSPGNIYSKVRSLTEEDADIKEIAEVIERDPSITAKILEVANSAFYGIRTGSIRQAIAYLGLINVNSIILNTGTYEGMYSIKNSYIREDIKMLWEHSNMTNKIVSFLYRQLLNKKIPDTCAMAGLLHDIGKVLVINNFTDKYLEAISKTGDYEDPFEYFEEMELLQASHSEIGGYLLNWWELPHPIVESALFHNNPFDERLINKELVAIVHIADIYSQNIIWKGSYKNIDDKVFDIFNISKEECDELMEELDIGYHPI